MRRVPRAHGRTARNAGDGMSVRCSRRAGEWDLAGQDEATMQRQKYLWNALVDYWFRMEFDGWENLPESPVLLVGIHSGAPFVWDAWTVGVQWWRRFGQERPLHGTAHDALMAIPVIGRYFRAMGVLPAAPDSIATAWPRDATSRCGPVARSTRCGRGASGTVPTSLAAGASSRWRSAPVCRSCRSRPSVAPTPCRCSSAATARPGSAARQAVAHQGLSAGAVAALGNRSGGPAAAAAAGQDPYAPDAAGRT